MLASQRMRSIHRTNHVCLLLILRLSFRSTAKALNSFVYKRSHVTVWNWVQQLFNPNKFYLKRSRVTAFIIDETMLQIGSEQAWLWIAIIRRDPLFSRTILSIRLVLHDSTSHERVANDCSLYVDNILQVVRIEQYSGGRICQTCLEIDLMPTWR